MKHDIYSITVMPSDKGLYLKITANNGGTINLSGEFDKVYPILDTIVLGMCGEKMEGDYLQ